MAAHKRSLALGLGPIPKFTYRLVVIRGLDHVGLVLKKWEKRKEKAESKIRTQSAAIIMTKNLQ
jgi:hypothetical protein